MVALEFTYQKNDVPVSLDSMPNASSGSGAKGSNMIAARSSPIPVLVSKVALLSVQIWTMKNHECDSYHMYLRPVKPVPFVYNLYSLLLQCSHID